jgi:hypothetical protein
LFAALGSILKWLVLLPVFVLVVLLAIANDQSVIVRLNPFAPDDPVLSVELALYQIGFILFALGVIAGGVVAWNGQRRARRRAQERALAAPPRAAPEQWLAPRTGEGQPSGAAAFLPRPQRG